MSDDDDELFTRRFMWHLRYVTWKMRQARRFGRKLECGCTQLPWMWRPSLYRYGCARHGLGKS